MNLVELIYSLQEDSNKQLRGSELLKFIGFCIQNAHQSVSQNYQDIWALWNTKNKQSNDFFFVEFGATDGTTISNTYLLEKEFGWKGILAEPNPSFHEDLLKSRTCNISKGCVYNESGKTVDFVMADVGSLSTIKGFGNDEFVEERKNSKIIKVDTISLIDLLTIYDAPKVIDYLSIDTEGSEYGILNAFFQDNTEYDIRNVTVEHNFSMRDKLYELMTANGYTRQFTELSRWDDFYTKDNTHG